MATTVNTAKKKTNYTYKLNPDSNLANPGDLTDLYNKTYGGTSKAQAGTLAQSRPQVDAMTIRDRLWDAFDLSYGVQRQRSDESYDNAKSQTDNQLLGRGMQRSSYGAQVLSNLDAKKIQAQNDIYGQQIAEYEKALLNVEQQEREAEQWQKEFDEQVRQFNILHGLEGGGAGGGGGGRGRGGRRNGVNDAKLADELDPLKALYDAATAPPPVVKPRTRPSTTPWRPEPNSSKSNMYR